MTINFNPDGQEILEINNLVYDLMPSDITVFTDNALKEDVYFRSKGAFTFRSKHSESEVILSFPIPLLNPEKLEAYSNEEQSLFTKGIELIAQLSNFPFCFVRSARIYSYLGVSYVTPNDYLIFGVSNITLTQDNRVPGILIAEVKLLLHNPSNLIRDMTFATDITVDAWKGISQNKSVKDLKDSPIFANYMSALTSSTMSKYIVALHEIGVDLTTTNFKTPQTLSHVVIKMPYVSTVDALKIINNDSEVILDISEDNQKAIEYSDFKMFDRFESGDRTFDGGALKEFQANYEDDLKFLTHRDLYLQNWRMYYLADRDIFNPEINAIQTISISKDNAFAKHFVGSSQHGYLQFLGQYPARLSISSVYNSKGSYEYNQESSFNLFKVLLNSVDSNNTVYPGANAYNHLKVKTIGSLLMGVSGFLPGECQLTSASEASNTEVYTTTFVENSLDKFIEDTKVKVGREVVSTKQQAAAILSLDLYINSISASMGSATKDKPFNYAVHSKILHNVALLAKEMHKEMLGNGEDSGVSKIEGQGIASLDEAYFDDFISRTSKTMDQLEMMKVLPKAKRTIGLLGIRMQINEAKMTGDASKDSDKKVNTTFTNPNTGKVTSKDVNASEKYNFSNFANTLIQKINNDISLLKEGGFLDLKETTKKQVTDISDLNNQYLYDSFVGEAHKDLGLDLYIKNQSVRRRMNPFFFVKGTPVVQVEDFQAAMKLINTDTVKQLKSVVNREIGEGGLLSGFGSSTESLISEMPTLSESRYNAAKDAADDPSAAEGTASSLDSQNGIGSYDIPAHPYKIGNVKPWVAYAAAVLGPKFGIKTVYGVGERGNKSDHPIGLALDFMTTGSPGDQLAAYAVANYKALNISYVLWKQKSWFPSKGWRQMEDRGGATANHMDHVHISFLSAPTDTTYMKNGNPGSGMAGVATLGKGSYIEQAFNHLVSKGFSPISACAVIGNFRQESGPKLDPTVINKIGAAGIGQWLNKKGTNIGRRTNLNNFAKKQGRPWNTIQLQLDFFIHEITNDPYESGRTNWSAFKQGSNLEKLTVLFRKAYERPGNHEAKDSQRIIYAKEVYKTFAVGASNGGVPATYSSPKTLSSASTDAYSRASGKASTKPSVKNNNGAPSKAKASIVPVTLNDLPKASVITVKVVDVVDGDTITVSSPSILKGKPFRVRIAGVDAPETDKKEYGVGKTTQPNQYYGPEARAFAISQLGNKTVILSKYSVDIYGRMLAEVGYGGGKVFTDELLKGGYGTATSLDPYRRSLEAKALANKVGMWKSPNRVIKGDTFRDNFKTNTITDAKLLADPNQQPSDWKGLGSKGTASKTPSKNTPTGTIPSSQGATPLSDTTAGLSNNWLPVDPTKITKVSSSFGIRIAPTNGKYYKKGDKVFHKGLDISASGGANVFASCSGTIRQERSSSYGNRVVLYCDAQGFKATYNHLSGFSKKTGRVAKGDVIGYVGSTGQSTGNHLHYEVLFNGVFLNPLYTKDLNSIPTGVPLNPKDYIAKQALLSDTELVSWKRGEIKLAKGSQGLYDGTALTVYNGEGATAGAVPTIDSMSMEEVQGYSVDKVEMDQAYSVFNEDLQIEKHIDKMFSNFDLGMNISFPIVKAYVTVGNEADDLFTSDVPLAPVLYFELPTLHDLNVVTNNDYNPVDVCTFSMINPSSIRTSTDFYGDASFGANLYNMDTQYYNVFFADKVKLKPGMKIHIRAGYSNAPGELKTLFNGIIVETSGSNDSLINVQCESFAAELLHNSMGPMKPIDLSGGKNASTGLLIAYSLLTDNVNHFGSSPSSARTFLAIMDSLIGNNPLAKAGSDAGAAISSTDKPSTTEVDGSAAIKPDHSLAGNGDMRDPENKPLIMPINFSDGLSLVNVSRANLASRLFTNIHCDAIDMAHDQYRSTFFTRISKGIQWFDSKWFYNYFVFRSTSWSVLKEMEYRHPGTLAKPLWYEDRMTMFFGIKEQLYVAKDLPAKFMHDSGIAGLAKNIHQPYSAKYLAERHKRLEPATGFHLLSSKLNILDNNMGLNREFATRIHTNYYSSKYEGNFIQSDADVVTVDLDDNLVPFDIREETLSLNGCHGKYSAWVYSIQELKKQTEMMYTGTITVTGKPDMRAGDYAYLEDSDRGFSGVIKIRECSHHFSVTSGYTTVITPGLHVECTQFYWSSLFTQLGMASKMLLLKADLSVSRLLTTNTIAESYVDYLKVIQSNQKLSKGDIVAGMGGSVILSGMTMYMLYRMLKSSSKMNIANLPKGYSPAQLASYVKSLHTKGGAVIGSGKNLISTHINPKVANAATKIGSFGKNGLNVATNSAKILSKVKDIMNLRAFGVLKIASKVPWSILKGVGSVSATIGRGLIGFAFTNPISAILAIVGTLMFSVVMSKFRGLELTHNPLLMFPLLYNGKPYVAGISGYENNSIIEGWMSNLKKNIKVLKKGSHHLRATTAGTSTTAEYQAKALDVAAATASAISISAEAISSYISEPLGKDKY